MGTQPVTVEHLAAFAATFRDLADPGIYAGCLEVTDCSSTPPPLRIAFLTSACDSPGSRTRTYLHIGRYRAPPVPDPMVAAIAELAGRNVLYLVKHFDLTAEITGQPTGGLLGGATTRDAPSSRGTGWLPPGWNQPYFSGRVDEDFFKSCAT